MRPHVLIVLTASAVASAQSSEVTTSAAAITRLLGAEQPQAEWFAPEFLAQVTFETINAQLAGIRQSIGAFVRLDPGQGQPLAVFERGTLLITTAPVDAQGRLTSFGAVPGPSSPAAQTPQISSLLTRVFEPGQVDAALFAPDFLAAVPVASLQQTLNSVRAQFGAFVRVDLSQPVPQVIFENGTLNVTTFALNDGGQISGLVIAPATPEASFATLVEAQAAFAALPGRVSLLVREVGSSQPPLAALSSGRLLAVASSFKLAILGELQAQINAGQRAWTDEVTLEDPDKSLPSGSLQNEATGSLYSLRDLATRMISVSDNTATDLLLRVVGRAAVEARLGQTAMPSTREAFALKNPANLELLRAYRSAGLNRAARRAVLTQAATALLPGTGVFAGGPVAQDVEWFASTERLCNLMAEVAALPETQFNPGVADANDFEDISYKGGSEGGVLNLTTQVTTKAGRTLCISATWNDARNLNEGQFLGLYTGLLKLLR
ncbi:serine hydrolase [Deinococcus sp. QL22]|uniref:serine hydrolase n=1 Tax=Deinococcus sp. QL22 TaxID=2939437 RepID=UPI002017E3F6|nr:serine hydrolase [Deinococcus sp. QL22]UQN09551.1 serine hydrolase [Deinococcus sp. QL22]